MSRIASLILFSVFFTFTALAEVHTLTLKQALDIALKQSPDMLLARFDELKAQQAVLEARDPFFPRVVVGSGLAYTNGFPLSIEGSAPSIIRADAIQTLFNREKSWLVAKAKEEARGAGVDLQAKREDVVLNTANAYLEANKARRAADAAAQQLKSLERIAEATKSRVEEGRELQLEAKKIAARVAQAKYSLSVFNMDVDYQEASLAILLGFPAADRVRPAGEERDPLQMPGSEEAAVTDAIANNKTLKSLQSKLQAAGMAVKANEAARLPRMDLVAQYGLFAKFNNFDDYYRTFQRNNGQVGVSFQIPIVAGSAASARKQQAESQSARLRVEMAHTRNKISVETRRMFQDIQAAESFREATHLDFDVSHEQVSVLMAQLEEGRAGVRQLEEARFVENQKWSAYLDAQHRLEKLKLALLKETGELLAALQ